MRSGLFEYLCTPLASLSIVAFDNLAWHYHKAIAYLGVYLSVFASALGSGMSRFLCVDGLKVNAKMSLHLALLLPFVALSFGYIYNNICVGNRDIF